MKLRTLKNNYVFAYPLLALSFVLGSCSQEEGDNVLPEKDSQNKTITFTVNPITAETQELSTRVTLLPGRNSDGLTWDDGDEVTFYYFNSDFSSEDVKTYAVSVDGGSTSISGGYPATSGDYNLYALYPHRVSNFSSTYTYLTMPASVDYDADLGYLRNAIFLYAQPEGSVLVDVSQEQVSGDVALDFKLLSALLRFDITNESSQDFTLQSVSIGFPDGSGAKLTRQAVLNEADGSVSPRSGVSQYDTQTLNFPDGYELNMGSDPLQGYLGIFPTAAATALNIDVDVLLSDNTTHTFELSVTNVQEMKAGNRYHIEIYIDDLAFDNLYALGEGTDKFGGKDHATYTITKDGTYYQYMTEPLSVAGSIRYENIPFTSCPGEYTPLIPDDLQLLYDVFIMDPYVAELFINGKAPYLRLYDGTPELSSAGFTIKLCSVGSGELKYQSLWFSDRNFTLGALDWEWDRHRYPVYCVKKFR
jgi:hypothetical protein